MQSHKNVSRFDQNININTKYFTLVGVKYYNINYNAVYSSAFPSPSIGPVVIETITKTRCRSNHKI